MSLYNYRLRMLFKVVAAILIREVQGHGLEAMLHEIGPRGSFLLDPNAEQELNDEDDSDHETTKQAPALSHSSLVQKFQYEYNQRAAHREQTSNTLPVCNTQSTQEIANEINSVFFSIAEKFLSAMDLDVDPWRGSGLRSKILRGVRSYLSPRVAPRIVEEINNFGEKIVKKKTKKNQQALGLDKKSHQATNLLFQDLCWLIRQDLVHHSADGVSKDLSVLPDGFDAIQWLANFRGVLGSEGMIPVEVFQEADKEVQKLERFLTGVDSSGKNSPIKCRPRRGDLAHAIPVAKHCTSSSSCKLTGPKGGYFAEPGLFYAQGRPDDHDSDETTKGAIHADYLMGEHLFILALWFDTGPLLATTKDRQKDFLIDEWIMEALFGVSLTFPNSQDNNAEKNRPRTTLMHHFDHAQPWTFLWLSLHMFQQRHSSTTSKGVAASSQVLPEGQQEASSLPPTTRAYHSALLTSLNKYTVAESRSVDPNLNSRHRQVHKLVPPTARGFSDADPNIRRRKHEGHQYCSSITFSRATNSLYRGVEPNSSKSPWNKWLSTIQKRKAVIEFPRDVVMSNVLSKVLTDDIEVVMSGKRRYEFVRN